MTARFTQEQRARVLRAAKEFGPFKRASSTPNADVVDYATESGNYFWTGLDDRQTRIALRLISIAS